MENIQEIKESVIQQLIDGGPGDEDGEGYFKVLEVEALIHYIEELEEKIKKL